MEGAVDEADVTAVDVARAGLRAAIEFTLNYFTAPVTAENVFEYSRRTGERLSPENIDQLRARERMKALYQSIGGRLRDAPTDETALQSLLRSWLGLPADGVVIQQPPSPLRDADGSDAGGLAAGLAEDTAGDASSADAGLEAATGLVDSGAAEGAAMDLAAGAAEAVGVVGGLEEVAETVGEVATVLGAALLA